MLPAFPKIRQKRIEANTAVMRQVAGRVSPISGQVKRHVQFEGAGNTIERHDDTVSTTNMGTVTVELSVPSDTPLVEFTPAKLYEYLVDMGKQIGEQEAKHLFAGLDKQLTEASQVVNAGGKPFSEDLILESLDKMQHDFTDDGQWFAPTIVMGGQTADVPGESFHRRLAELLSRKRDDFRRREADRVLAG